MNPSKQSLEFLKSIQESNPNLFAAKKIAIGISNLEKLIIKSFDAGRLSITSNPNLNSIFSQADELIRKTFGK